MLSSSRGDVIVFRGRIEIERSTINGSILLFCLFTAQAIGVYITLWNYDLLSHFKPALYAYVLYFSLGFVVLVKGLSYVIRYTGYEKLDRGLGRVKQDFLDGWLNVNYMLAFLVPMFFLPTFMALFSSMKSVIHLVQPFYLDEFFMKADRIVHFGLDPWRITHFFFGTEYVSVFLNYIYNLWFFIMFSYVLWQIVNVGFGRDRLQFLLGFVIAWPLIGNVFAIFLSSSGPVYYGDIVGDFSIFGPMMDILKDFNEPYKDSFLGIYALDTQAMLWADYLKNDTGIGSGISAMPSMHVSIAALLYFSGRQVSPYLGYGMMVFLILIQIGSVHLGWHYALDGYVAILMTWVLWKLCGRMADWAYRKT